MKKLSKLLEEAEKTEAKILELQEHLAEIRKAQELEENLQIVKGIRGMKLGARELFELLSSLKNGNVIIQRIHTEDTKKTESEEKKNAKKEEQEPVS